MIQKLLREPLVHYVALGIVLFAEYAFVTVGDDSGSDELIQVTANEVRWLANAWQGQRPPTAEELRGLVDASVRIEATEPEPIPKDHFDRSWGD